MDWTQRSSQKEQMDVKEFSFKEYRRCLNDIAKISRWIGQTRPIEDFIARIYSRGDYSPERPLRILEVGFGAGDLLAKLDRENNHLRLVGIDLHPWAEKVARSRHRQRTHISYLTADLREYRPQEPIDVVIGSLMLHHLTDDEIIGFFSWTMKVAQIGWVMCDLARSPVAFYGAKLLAAVLSSNETVKNDAPLSVQRAFRQKDLRHLTDEVGNDDWSIRVKSHFPYQYAVSAVRRGDYAY
jgi:2-polyprenyl-3-methyl-5-hydroxy-6-metoxy-1,4-benzoquinol methylase